jgi:dolichol-phosphate mannosyltransferase
MKELSFLIPLYNEEKNIIATIDTIVKSAQSLAIEFEIIITDDHSTDRSFQVATELSKIYPQLKVYKNIKNLGFAKTYFKCLEMSHSKYIVYISSDNDIDVINLKELLSHFKEAPIILQYCLNSKDRSYYRYLISNFYTGLLNFINKKNLHYYNGFNIYESSLVKSLKISEESFAFQSEIVSQLIQNNSFVQVPIQCSYHDESSTALRPKNIFGVIKFIFKKF